MTEVLITKISGFTTPFSGIACDVYGNNCSNIGEATTVPFLFTLPSQFNTAPAVQITLIDRVSSSKCDILYRRGLRFLQTISRL